MNLTISGHHLEVTPAIREYVQNKLERITRHFDQVIDIPRHPLHRQSHRERKTPEGRDQPALSGKTVYVESLAQDLYAAIDTLIDKLDRQVMKYKNKVQQHGHDAIKHLPDSYEPAAAAL
jgi:putative sigma-54 modulation protein